MRGSLRERRPGTWELIAQLPRDPVTGKPRQTTRTVTGTKRDAQRALSALIAEVAAGEVATSTATLDELIARWLEVKAERLSPTTAAEYRRLAKVIVSPALGDVVIRRLTARQLDNFYGALARERGLSASSIHQVPVWLRFGRPTIVEPDAGMLGLVPESLLASVGRWSRRLRATSVVGLYTGLAFGFGG